MTCPICKKKTVAQFKPFCSLRCADVDLGKWMTGQYATPSDGEDDDWEVAEEMQHNMPKTH